MIVLSQKQKRVLLILGVVAVLLLAIVAIVTAIRLQQVGTEPVAPSVPKSKPKAVEAIPTPGADSACVKTWTISAVLTCNDASQFNDDFSASTLDTTKWIPTANGGATINISGGQLVISIPQQTSQQSSNVRSKTISGDFVVEVDLVGVQTGDSGSVEMSFFGGGENRARVSRYKTPSGERVETSFAGLNLVSVDLPAGTGAVRARIVREGSDIKTYYRLSGSSVFNLITETTSGFAGEGLFELYSIVFPPGFLATVATFDNFAITCLSAPTATPTPTGTITPTRTPTPTATPTAMPTGTVACIDLDLPGGTTRKQNENITFVCKGEPSAGVTQCRFRFGDGSAEMFEDDCNVIKSYASLGTYTISCEVRDTAGNWQASAGCGGSIEIVSGPTSTPASGATAYPTNQQSVPKPSAIPTVAQQALPQAGGILPTIGAAVAGLGIILLGLLLLL